MVGINSMGTLKKGVPSAHAKFRNLDMCYVELYLRMNLCQCLQVEFSLLHLFSVAMWHKSCNVL